MDQSDAVPEAVPDLISSVECGASGGASAANTQDAGDQPDARSLNM